MGGKSKIIIRNKSGDEIGVVYISTEATAYKRYVEGLEQYKNILIPLMCVNITADGRAANKSGKRILSTAENKIYTLFDEIIGYEGASKAFFSEVRPFAKVKGKFYCEQCLELVKQCTNTKSGGKQHE